MTETLSPSSKARVTGARGGPREAGAAGPCAALSTRSRALDNLRGLAILLMVADHLALWHPGLSPLRHYVTRLAMPLFFVIGGHLVKRLTWRHLGIGVIGLVLPLVVPWIDAPNVLLWYALGAVVVTQLRRAFGVHGLVVLVALPLTQYANLFVITGWGNSYVAPALLGLMALGALIPRDFFTFADNWPNVLSRVGRFPLSVYVSHLLCIEAFVLVWRHVA